MLKLKLYKLLRASTLLRLQAIAPVILAVIFFTAGQAAAVTRLTDRSLFLNTSLAGATTSYTITFKYTTLTTVGSIDMLFCNDPIPTDPCDPPVGLDASGAVLSAQSGETGYSLSTVTTNHLVLTRAPSVVGSETSSYTFSNIVNPTDSTQSFSIRLSDYSSDDASGPLIDLGSVVSQVNPGLDLEAQVPPILLFCLAQEVSQNCEEGSGGNYSDLGDLSPTQTLTATSQMAVGTNASSGYAITVNGSTMSAGTHIISALTNPTPSKLGDDQFGINLVANNAPQLGSDPDGASTNDVVNPDYAIPNEFTYNNGDTVATAPNVSLIKRFTISYIVNSAANLSPGVYTTTLTFICSGHF